MSFHSDLVDLDIHALTAVTYADIAARDADTAFHSVTTNVNRVVRINSPVSYYILGSIAPTWVELSNTQNDAFIEHVDTPASFSGQAGNVLQVNAGATAVEFGQALRTTDSPQFAVVTLGNAGLIVGASVPFSDAAGVLTLQNVDALDVVTESTIEAAIDALANLTSIQGQSITFTGALTVSGASSIDQDLRVAASPQFVGLTLTGDLTVQGTTTLLDTLTLQIEDKNIELGKVTTPTDATASGGGITLLGTTNKTLIWNSVTGAWEFNQDVLMSGVATIGALASPPTDVSLHLTDATKAFLPNRGTTAQRDAITAVSGMQYYNTDTSDQEFYNGVAWQSMGGGDVTGPGGATDNALVRFNQATGLAIQNSLAILDDLGALSGLTQLDVTDIATLDSAGMTYAPNKSVFQEAYATDEDLVLSLDFRDVFDRSAFGNDVVLEGAAAINSAAGRIGSGLRLDGSVGTIARVADDVSLRFTDTITVQAWIFPNTDGAGFEPIISKIDSGTGNGWNFTYQSNALRITFRFNNGATVNDTFATIGTVPTSTWTHVSMTFDDSTKQLKTYINGVLKDTRTFTVGWTDSADDLCIGCRLKNGNVDNRFNGDITGVRVYNRVMADDEIRGHYTRHPLYASQSAIVADRWKVQDTSGVAWMDFGPTTRLPRTANPLKEVDVYSAADLPAAIIAPDGISRRPLGVGTIYILHETFVWPRLLFPKLVSQTAFEVTQIQSARPDVNILIDGPNEPGGDASTPHFWGREMGVISIRDMSMIDIGNAFAGRSTVLFDLVGGGLQSTFSMDFFAAFNFADLGQLIDMSVLNLSWFLAGNERGVIVRSLSAAIFHTLETEQLVTGGLAMKTAHFTFQGATDTVAISGGNIRLLAGDSAFNFDTSFTGSADIVGMSYKGPTSGNFFRPDISKSITAITAEDEQTFFSAAVSPLNAAHTRIETNFIRKNHKGDPILVEGITSTAYDGLHIIQAVSDNQTAFDIPVVFSVTTNGTTVETIFTVANHGLVAGETVIISGTTSYNGTHTITRINDDNNFLIAIAFVANDATGTVTATSKTQKSVGINVTACGAQPNSIILGFGEMNGNSTATVIAASDTYQAIDVSGIVDNAVSERFSLTDATAGIYTYNGDKPIAAAVTAHLSATKVGANIEVRFATSVNGAIPVFASAAYAPMTMESVKKSATMGQFVNLVPGDTVQVMVAEEGDSDNLTITDFVIQVER